ncbi:MAG: hypothetical protein LN568_06925 [Rickettsia endosymbiont of Pseudomimeciton antennatum]|nr:hypothetical protein [Rickettsia endosymbiont of Pseudomimeciton antennatum]
MKDFIPSTLLTKSFALLYAIGSNVVYAFSIGENTGIAKANDSTSKLTPSVLPSIPDQYKNDSALIEKIAQAANLSEYPNEIAENLRSDRAKRSKLKEYDNLDDGDLNSLFERYAENYTMAEESPTHIEPNNAPLRRGIAILIKPQATADQEGEVIGNTTANITANTTGNTIGITILGVFVFVLMSSITSYACKKGKEACYESLIRCLIKNELQKAIALGNKHPGGNIYDSSSIPGTSAGQNVFILEDNVVNMTEGGVVVMGDTSKTTAGVYSNDSEEWI